jgi:hypothetical protein
MSWGSVHRWVRRLEWNQLDRRLRPCKRLRFAIAAWLAVAFLLTSMTTASDTPPTIRPFGPRKVTRSDAIPGYVELSDGTVYPGHLYLTRDARLKIFDATAERQREIPLRVVRKIQCKAEREWLEKEWRFKENASDEKIFTGRSYPARECVHTITLQDGRKIVGPLSAIVYVARKEGAKPTRLLLHKRQKGPVGTQLKSLVYVRTIALGEAAFAEGQRRSRRASSGREKKQTTSRCSTQVGDPLGLAGWGLSTDTIRG